jgi:hypothetical protein
MNFGSSYGSTTSPPHGKEYLTKRDLVNSQDDNNTEYYECFSQHPDERSPVRSSSSSSSPILVAKNVEGFHQEAGESAEEDQDKISHFTHLDLPSHYSNILMKPSYKYSMPILMVILLSVFLVYSSSVFTASGAMTATEDMEEKYYSNNPNLRSSIAAAKAEDDMLDPRVNKTIGVIMGGAIGAQVGGQFGTAAGEETGMKMGGSA